MISKEVLPKLIATADEKFSAQLGDLKRVLVEYAKRGSTKNMSRKYFRLAVEEISVKLGEPNGGTDESSDANGDDNSEEKAKAHERTAQDEIFNHVMVEEGYNTHSPLEDKIKANGKHRVVVLDKEDEEDDEEEEQIVYDEEYEEEEGDEVFVDPYEDLSEEEVMARMPPYFNKTNKQKKKYFNNLNKNYLSKLGNMKKGVAEDKPRVNFDLKKNAIKKFKKNQKVSLQN